MEENKYQTIVTFTIIILSLVFAAIFAEFLGLGKGGFNIQILFTQFSFYGFPLVASVIVILLIYALEIFYFRKDDVKYGNFLFFNSLGEGPSMLTNKFKNPIKLLWISLIFAILLGAFATFFNQTYLGVGKIGEQFTTVDGILYNWLLVVTSENMQVFAFAIAGILGLRFLARKYKWDKTSFLIIASILVIILFMIFGYVNHQMRYSGSEQRMSQVLLFWAILGIITVFTGSFIPAWVLHGINNTFVEIPIASKEIFIIYVVFIEVVLAVSYYFIFMRKK